MKCLWGFFFKIFLFFLQNSLSLPDIRLSIFRLPDQSEYQIVTLIMFCSCQAGFGPYLTKHSNLCA